MDGSSMIPLYIFVHLGSIFVIWGPALLSYGIVPFGERKDSIMVFFLPSFLMLEVFPKFIQFC